MPKHMKHQGGKMSEDMKRMKMGSEAFEKILEESLAKAKKVKEKNRKEELKWAKESLGRDLLRVMELEHHDA